MKKNINHFSDFPGYQSNFLFNFSVHALPMGIKP